MIFAHTENFIEKDEKEQDPNLSIAKGFLHLGEFDCLIVDTCSIRLASGYKQSLLFLGKALGSHDVIRQKKQKYDSPDDGNATAEKEYNSPYSKIALVLSNGVE